MNVVYALAVPLADNDFDWGHMNMDMDGGWWIVMLLGMLLFWGLVVFGIFWLVRESIGRRQDDPMAILDRRLADGQISVKEYEQRRKVLISGRG